MDGSIEVPVSLHSSNPVLLITPLTLGLLFRLYPSLASSSCGICHRCYFLSIHAPKMLIPHSFQLNFCSSIIWKMKAEFKNPHCCVYVPYMSLYDQGPH